MGWAMGDGVAGVLSAIEIRRPVVWNRDNGVRVYPGFQILPFSVIPAQAGIQYGPGCRCTLSGLLVHLQNPLSSDAELDDNDSCGMNPDAVVLCRWI